MKAPFPYFGGKSRVADVVWDALGDVSNYVEPFAGSLAVLLGRPDTHKGYIETVNDKDAYICNFWRALQADPEAVAHYANWPVNETDLFARHLWLVNEGQRQMRGGLEKDPDWYDAKIAGWWVWGINAWIGRGWCSGKGPWHLGDGGRGVNRQLPHLGDGRGVNRQLPHLGEYFEALAARLRRVRVCFGDWNRVVTRGALAAGSTVGVFLDPPYSAESRDKNLYNKDSLTVAQDVGAWCRANQDDPRLRIVLCGYEGEHDLPGWSKYAYSTNGSYNTSANAGKNQNRHRERLWFSPSIARAQQGQVPLVGLAVAGGA